MGYTLCCKEGSGDLPQENVVILRPVNAILINNFTLDQLF